MQPCRFNLRVVECRLAALLLARQLGSSPQELDSIRRLKQVEHRLLHDDGCSAAAADTSQQESMAAPADVAARAARLVARAQALLHEQPYSLQEVEQLLGFPCRELFAGSPAQLQALLAAAGLPQDAPPAGSAAATQPSPALRFAACNSSGNGHSGSSCSTAAVFHLQQRAQHVFSEACRVLQFKATCQDASLEGEAKLAELGALMDASHASCAGLYQCSCTELDDLVALAKEAGALGARLTGGCRQ